MAAELPKQIGRYRIRGPLAATETSILLEAHDPGLGQPVALQLFGRPFVTENFLATLQRDARRLSHLRHRQLLQVHGAGLELGHAFLVTAIPPGHKLEEALAGGPLSPAEAEETITAIAAGVAAIHDAGLLHMNLAPGSIYINDEGQPVVGGYCPLNPRESLFAAPEQQQGQPLSRRSDIYSLGMLLLYLLSGRSQRTIASMAQLPVAYQDVVRKATAAASLARYSSVQEMIAALPGIQPDEPTTPLLIEPMEEYELDPEPEDAAPEFSVIRELPPAPDPAERLPDLSQKQGGVPLLPIGLGLVFVCLALGALGWYFGGDLVAGAEPTAAAPTLHPTAVANATSTPTPAPSPTRTPTATPIPVQISISSPTGGTTIDLGQSVQLNFLLSDPVGIRTVNILANGQVIANYNAGGVTVFEVDEPWVPNRRGSKLIEVIAVNRNGEQLPLETTTIRVIDQALLARHSDTWTRIENNVSEIRGLDPLEPVFPDMLSRPAYSQQVVQDDVYYSEEGAWYDVVLLHAFDFVPLTFDLYHEYPRYVTDSVTGYYDTVTKEFVILSDNDEMDANNYWVYIFLFMTALQDQHFELGRLNTDVNGYEENLALYALSAGEAGLVQNLYLDYGYFTDAQLVELYSDYYFDVYNIKAQVPSNLPDVLVNDFWFPHTTGYDFVNTLFQRNGWAGVTAAWNNLPVSSEQIIHPFQYLAGDVPIPVTLPDLGQVLPAGYTLYDQDSFGEFYLREYLAQELDEGRVNQAATGWGGDQYAVYLHENQSDIVMVLRSAWDSPGDAQEFLAIYPDYAAAAYDIAGSETEDGGRCWVNQFVVCLYALGDETLIIRAPYLALAETIAASFR